MKKLMVVLLVLGFVCAVPAMAAAQTVDQRVSQLEEMVKGMKMSAALGFHPYASFRPHLGYYSVSEDFSQSQLGAPAMGPTIGADDSGTILSLGGQSRFGAKAAVSKDMGGQVEFGLTDTTRGGDVNSVYLRLAVGVWNFGSGKLTVGKTYTPGTFLGYSSMMGDIGDNGDAEMLVGGLSYIGRQPQVQLSFGDFDLALIEPNNGASAYGGDVDFILPRIEAAYVLRTEMVNIRPLAGFQTYDLEGGTGDGESIASYLLGVGASFDLDPAYLKGTVSYMQNAGNYGQAVFGLVNNSVGVLNAQPAAGGDFEDSALMQATLVAGANLNDDFSVEAGVGYMGAEVDVAQGTTAEQTAMLFYVQAPYQLAKGIKVIPEIGFLDRGDLAVDGSPDIDQGDLSYLDFNFRVDL